jgi:hypothetical protein
MISLMESVGDKRVRFHLSGLPPVLFSPKSRKAPRRSGVTPPFEPYAENLPLQSGFYSYVIDSVGRFRVQWGNTSSHGAMVNYERIASAGNFRIGRLGKLAEVRITSYDYGIFCRGPNDRFLAYTISAFVGHPAFDASENVIFHYKDQLYGTESVNRHAEPISGETLQSYLDSLESEGLGDKITRKLDDAQIRSFTKYQPPAPPRLHQMHLDQLVVSIEEGESFGEFRPGPPQPRYSLESPSPYSGKNNFVIDEAGWLIVGMSGHHFLSGGNAVGGAGHLILDESGNISGIHLNFSGHYRPPLTFDYVRYVYRLLANHPLFSITPDCVVHGRKFDDAGRSLVIGFTGAEIISDDPEAEESLEMMLV